MVEQQSFEIGLRHVGAAFEQPHERRAEATRERLLVAPRRHVDIDAVKPSEAEIDRVENLQCALQRFAMLSFVHVLFERAK